MNSGLKGETPLHDAVPAVRTVGSYLAESPAIASASADTAPVRTAPRVSDLLVQHLPYLKIAATVAKRETSYFRIE